MELPAGQAKNIFGQLDRNLRQIEDALHVSIIPRGGIVKIRGRREDVAETMQRRAERNVPLCFLRMRTSSSTQPPDVRSNRKRPDRSGMWTPSATI